MKIDFEGISPIVVPNFKGGEGELVRRAYADQANSIVRIFLEHGSSIGTHTHSDDSEVIYVIDGVGRVNDSTGEYFIKAGDCHYCPQGEWHTIMSVGDSPLQMLAVIGKHA